MTERMEGRLLPRSFYARDPVLVAPDLIGRLLVKELDGRILAGRIVEAEAYGFDDPASHAYRGERPRNRSMFGPPGHAYVYSSHGIHRCLNAVTLRGTAVLIRAVEPLEGLDEMVRRRSVDDPRLLCAGPGRLCRAFGIELAEDGADLCAGRGLWVASGQRAGDVAATTRVGVTLAADRAWRFVEAGSQFASRRAQLGPSSRSARLRSARGSGSARARARGSA